MTSASVEMSNSVPLRLALTLTDALGKTMLLIVSEGVTEDERLIEMLAVELAITLAVREVIGDLELL